jgi:hypothetical protein
MNPIICGLIAGLIIACLIIIGLCVGIVTMNYLETLRESLIDGSGWDKMCRPRPTDEWADEQINAMTNVELLERVGWIEDAARTNR